MTRYAFTTTLDAAAVSNAGQESEAAADLTQRPGERSRVGGGSPIDDDERAPTHRYLKAVFFGEPVPPHPADKPLPAHVAVGSTDQTRLEKTPRSR